MLFSLVFGMGYFRFYAYKIILCFISDVVDFLKGLSPNELTGVRELQRRDLLQRASIYVTMVDNNSSLDNYGNAYNYAYPIN